MSFAQVLLATATLITALKGRDKFDIWKKDPKNATRTNPAETEADAEAPEVSDK